MKVNEYLKTELEKVSKMDAEQKISYFKTYYMIPALICIFLIGCLIWYLHDAFFGRINYIYSGALCACNISDDGRKILTDDFCGLLGGSKREGVYLSDDLILNYDEEDAYNNQSTDITIYTMMAAGEFDYMLMDKSVVKHLVDMDGFCAIDDIVNNYNIVPQDCITGNDGEVVAFKLPDRTREKLGIYGNTGNDIYIGFVYKNKSNIEKEVFIEYLEANNEDIIAL